jgi:Glyoxalase-like domain
MVKTNPSSRYTHLATPECPTLDVFLQAITSQESQLHFDIETDDVEAEMRRLERLGGHTAGARLSHGG